MACEMWGGIASADRSKKPFRGGANLKIWPRGNLNRDRTASISVASGASLRKTTNAHPIGLFSKNLRRFSTRSKRHQSDSSFNTIDIMTISQFDVSNDLCSVNSPC